MFMYVLMLMNICNFLINMCRVYIQKAKAELIAPLVVGKVIIDKSRGEVSLLEQGTIENVSKLIKIKKNKNF